MCCQVNVTKGTLSQAEIDAYVDHARQKYNREPLSMDIAVDGDEVELSYDFGNVPFQRIHHGLSCGHARPLQQRQARRGA